MSSYISVLALLIGLSSWQTGNGTLQAPPPAAKILAKKQQCPLRIEFSVEPSKTIYEPINYTLTITNISPEAIRIYDPSMSHFWEFAFHTLKGETVAERPSNVISCPVIGLVRLPVLKAVEKLVCKIQMPRSFHFSGSPPENLAVTCVYKTDWLRSDAPTNDHGPPVWTGTTESNALVIELSDLDHSTLLRMFAGR